MSSYKKASINTIHPFLGISVRNNQCFCHTNVCFSYGPNNCSALREGKNFQDSCICLHSFDQNKETAITGTSTLADAYRVILFHSQ